MKKKTFFLSSKLWCLGALAFSLLATSCAQDGFDDETFEMTVRDTQVESPSADKITIRQNSSGTEQIISWPVVLGAGGFECKVVDESDATNPEVVFDQIVDGCTFRAKRDDDANYRIYIRALGNKEYNNKDAETTTEIAYSTIVEPYKTIEPGTDLAVFFKSEQIPANEIDETTKEVVAIAYQLRAGESYIMSDVVSFGNRKVLLYSTKAGADIKFTGEKAKFEIQNGLTLRNLRIDCAESNAAAFIDCSDTPEEKVPFNESLYPEAGTTGSYLISEPVEIKNCMLKDVKKALIATGEKNGWAIRTVTIMNNIIQMDNEKDNFLNFKGTGNDTRNSSFKELLIQNNTIYNLKENTTKYAIQICHNSTVYKLFNADNKIAGLLKWQISNNTIMRVFTGTDRAFGNNVPTAKCLTNIITENIFIDCYKIEKYALSSQEVTAYNNYFHGILTKVSDADIAMGTLADPGFVPPTTSLDLTQPNGGLNLTPSGVAFTAGAGDPRWLSE